MEELDRWYQQTAGSLRVVLRVRLQNELDVEACLNRVFEKLWLRGHAVAPAARRAWLFVVAKNEATQWLRGSARQTTECLADGQDCDVGQAEPLQALLLDEQLARLRAAQGKLTDDQVQILRYRFQDDLTFREIAEQLQIPIGTALTRARAAILKLKRILDDED